MKTRKRYKQGTAATRRMKRPVRPVQRSFRRMLQPKISGNAPIFNHITDRVVLPMDCHMVTGPKRYNEMKIGTFEDPTFRVYAENGSQTVLLGLSMYDIALLTMSRFHLRDFSAMELSKSTTWKFTYLALRSISFRLHKTESVPHSIPKISATSLYYMPRKIPEYSHHTPIKVSSKHDGSCKLEMPQPLSYVPLQSLADQSLATIYIAIQCHQIMSLMIPEKASVAQPAPSPLMGTVVIDCEIRQTLTDINNDLLGVPTSLKATHKILPANK